MSKPLSYDVVKEKFESEGYKLITTEVEYIDTLHKLKVVCPIGHTIEIN